MPPGTTARQSNDHDHDRDYRNNHDRVAAAVAASAAPVAEPASIHIHRTNKTLTVFSPASQKILYSLMLLRILNALLVVTYFQPDEFWQSQEVAHEVVFGYGHLTWEWSRRIRGFAHPMLFAAIYKLLQLTGLDDTYLLVTAPRILQGCFAGIADFFVFHLAASMFGSGTAKWALVAMMLSWFNFYCMVRTFSNSIEASLTAAALFYWPWPGSLSQHRISRRDSRIALALAAAACIIRPTNAIIWIFLGTALLFRIGINAKFIFDTGFIAVFAIALSIVIDYQFYKVPWIFPPIEFIRLNVGKGVASLYGTHSLHWYFSHGLPVVMLTLLPFSIWGVIWITDTSKRHFFWMCIWTMCALSIEPHKEFRFLLPIVPPLMMYAGHGLYIVEQSDLNARRRGWRSHLMRSLAFIAVPNFIAAAYFSRVHKAGIISVMDWLRQEVRYADMDGILFLMPCHSTPFYSYIHRNVPMRFITCEPMIDPPRVAGLFDELGLLYSNPEEFFRTFFEHKIGNKTIPWGTEADAVLPEPKLQLGTNGKPIWPARRVVSRENRRFRKPAETDRAAVVTATALHDPAYDIPAPGQFYTIRQYQWVSHIVTFDNEYLGESLASLMQGSDYRECARFYNGPINDDHLQVGDVVVLCRPLHPNTPKVAPTSTPVSV